MHPSGKTPTATSFPSKLPHVRDTHKLSKDRLLIDADPQPNPCWLWLNSADPPLPQQEAHIKEAKRTGKYGEQGVIKPTCNAIDYIEKQVWTNGVWTEEVWTEGGYLLRPRTHVHPPPPPPPLVSPYRHSLRSSSLAFSVPPLAVGRSIQRCRGIMTPHPDPRLPACGAELQHPGCSDAPSPSPPSGDHGCGEAPTPLL